MPSRRSDRPMSEVYIITVYHCKHPNHTVCVCYVAAQKVRDHALRRVCVGGDAVDKDCCGLGEVVAEFTHKHVCVTELARITQQDENDQPHSVGFANLDSQKSTE